MKNGVKGFVLGLSDNRWAMAGLLLVVSIGIRFWHYCASPIGWDEPFTIFHAQRSLSELMSLFSNENNPPLFFLIMHFWVHIFGIEAEAVRVVPVLLSALTVPFTFLVCRRHFGPETALSVPLLMLFSNLQQYHAHNTRAYALFVLLTVWSLHHFLSLMDAPSRRHVFGLAIAGTLLLYNHFLGAVVLASYGIVTLSIRDLRQRILRPMIAAGMLVTLGFAPYLTILIHRFVATAGNGPGWVAKPGMQSLYNLLWSFCNQPVIVVVCLIIIVLGVSMTALRRERFSTKEMTVFALFLIPYFGLFITSQWFPMYMDHYLIFISPVFYISIVLLALRVGSEKWTKPLLTVLVLAFVFTFRPDSGHPTDERALVEHIRKKRVPGEAILINPEWNNLGFAYHFDREIFKDHAHLNDRLREVNVFPVGAAEELPNGFADKYVRAYQITPVSSHAEYIQKFRREIKTLYPNEKTDTVVNSTMVVIYTQ